MEVKKLIVQRIYILLLQSQNSFKELGNLALGYLALCPKHITEKLFFLWGMA